MLLLKISMNLTKIKNRISSSRTKHLFSSMLLIGLMTSAFIAKSATFTVTNNTWANTAGSLLWCVNQVNATAGPHLINFTNNGTAYIIQANSQITLNEQVTIDGSTSGFIVELNGTNALNTNGILINAGASGSIIRGLFITQYDFNAITLAGANNTILGGDRSLNYGNVLSGNLQAGIRIDNANNTQVLGNRIGVDAAGSSVVSNGFDGVNIIGTSTGSIIGGTNPNLRNIISGNGFNGINIENGAHTVIGNYIGINAAGTSALGNNQQGIRLFLNATGTIIGGDDASFRNIISGNKNNGIYAFVGSHTIKANYIGTNANGSAAIPNLENGVNIEATSTGNIIGGNTANSGNLISGNIYNGVNIFSGANTVSANYIGTDATGTLALGNARDGIRIAGISTGNTIGGNTAASKNVISANGYNGVELESGANTLEGNYIGINALGTASLGNLQDGVRIAIASTNNIIGTKNVISGNTLNGIRVLFGTHTIIGNYIGTDATGTLALPNLNGIDFISAGDASTVGGLTLADRNVISGNRETGLRSNNTKGLKVFGNIIGLDASGLNDLGNGIDGIYGRDFADNHQIGGATAAHRNIISGNGRDGVFYEFDIAGLTISGNYIGTDINGRAGVGNLGNDRNGISFNNRTTGTIISGNVASGNGLRFKTGQDNGVGIFGYESSAYTITKNIVGLEADGLVALGNTENGISLIISSTGIITENIVSSNGSWQTASTATAASPNAGKLPFGHGIVVNGSSTISVLGNKIGVDKNGEGKFGNLQSGLIFIFGDGFTVGTSTAADRNIIGNNLEFGIHFVQVGSNVSVKNNLIGQSPTAQNIGNLSGGIFLDGPVNSANIRIGGSLANESNVIANSTGTLQRFASACGVCISGNGNVSGAKNLIFNNSITCNAGLGIDLNLSGNMYDRWSNQYWGSPSVAPVTGSGNNKKSAPIVNATNSKNTVSGTGVVGDLVHVYDNTCDCEGEKYLATTTVAANGKWQVNLASPVLDNAHVSAIAVGADNNTSEFSGCCRVKSDSIKVEKSKLCFGDSTTIILSDHVGSSFQLQSSSSASGPWTNVGLAKTTRTDSTWKIIPSATGTVFYRIYAEAISWGNSGASKVCNTSSTKIISILTNPGISATVGDIIQPSCGLNNGGFKINTSGGASPINYSINDSLTFSTTSSYENQAANTYKIVVVDANSCSARSTVTLNTSTNPVINSVVSAKPTTCKGTDGTIEVSASGADGLLEYSINGGTSYQSSNSFTGLGESGSPYKIRVRYRTALCVVEHDKEIDFGSPNITLTLDANKTNLCESDTLKIIPTITGAVGTANMNWNLGASTSTVFVLSPVTTGTYTGVVTDSLGCTKSASIDIDADRLATKANVGSDLPICADSTAIVANVPSSGTGTWSKLSGQGTIKNVNNASTSISNLALGETKLIWTITNGLCPASKDTVSIMRDELPTKSDVGNDLKICMDTVQISANTPASGVGVWLKLSGQGIIKNVNSASTSITNLEVGEVKLIWTVTNGVCPVSKDTLSIVRDASPTKADASENRIVCLDSTAIIANVPSIGIGQWSNISAQGTIKNVNNASTSVSNLAVGETKLIWTISNGVCPSSADTLRITKSPALVKANAGIDQTICSTTAVLDASAPSVGTSTWSTNGIALVTSPTNPKTSVSNLQVGQNVFYWKTEDANCPAIFDTVIVTRQAVGVNETPIITSDKTSIDAGETVIIKQTPKQSNIRWYSSTDKNAWILLPDNDSVIVVTPNVLTYYTSTVDVNTCTGINLDTLIISIKVTTKRPIAIDDNESTNFQEDLVIEVLANDLDQDGGKKLILSSIEIIKQPLFGTLSIDNASGLVTYKPKAGYQGNDSFEYLFSDFTNTKSNVAVVTIRVNSRPPFKVYEVLTPNGDGKNDYMHIDNIEFYPNTNVQIFNRWGNVVWELPKTCGGYQNNDSKCSFVGNSNVGLGSGGDLPDGSYYYVIDGTKDGVKPCQGYLVKN